MEKRILSLLLALVMLLSLCPVTALATETDLTRPEQQEEVPAASETEAVEKVVSAAPPRLLGAGPTASWTALQDALNGRTIETIPGLFEINDNTITLTANFTAEEGNTTLYVIGTKTLDLNGHFINAAGQTSVGSVITVDAGANLTVKDSGDTEHYFTVDADGLWTLTATKTETTKTVKGGVITGGSATGGSATDGGGVNVAGKFAMEGGNIVGNTAANGGGVYISNGGTFAMEGGTITGNTATSGGGVYAFVEECLAAGTPITLADGTRTAIENLKKGDMVRVFDHETGEISSARLFDLWKYPAKQSGAFTLHFTNGIDVTAVGGHCFFDKAENQYAAINTENVNDYIGHQFYNVDDGCWETLTDVTFLTEAVDTYIIVSEKHMNVVAGGMLSNEDGIYTLMSNIFAFGENLTIDAAAKEADIAQYGLWGYENMQYFSRYAYDALNLQYMSVLFGRGILTPEEFAELEAYSAEIDPELYCSGKEAETTLPQKAEAKESLLTKIVSFLTAPFVKVAYAADLERLGPGVYFGGTAYVVDNKANTEANTEENNVFMSLTRNITLGNGDNGVIEPGETMRVGVTLQNGTGTFTGTAAAADTAYFFSDDPAYVVQHVTDHLELVKSWTALQNALNAATPTNGGGFTVSGSTIKLLADFKADTGDTTLRVSGKKTLDLNGHVIDAAGKLPVATGSVITVPNTATLTVIDNTTTPHKFSTDTDGKWVLDEDNGNYTVTGGVITGGKANNGGGVNVAGTFTMDGGNIIGNTATSGGGVYVNGTSATFAMEGGSITYNTATGGGGVSVSSGAGFLMSGDSKIMENKATGSGGGVYVTSSAKFTMNGGTIGSNTAVGGGGVLVFNDKTAFVMSGGSIEENTSTNAAYGGGVHFQSGTVTLGGTAKITGNTLSDGTTTSNFYLPKDKTITLGTGTNAPAGDMKVGVTTQNIPNSSTRVDITNVTNADYHERFTGDNASYEVVDNAAGTSHKVQLRAHEHTWGYIASGNVITASCTDTLMPCGTTTTLTLTAAGAVYNGAAKTATLTNLMAFKETTGADVGEIEYYKGGQKLDGAPKDAGDYTAKVTVQDKTASVSFTITKAEQAITADATQSVIYGDTGKSVTAERTAGDGALSYTVKSGSATDVVEVNAATGALTIHKVGETVITVSAAETNNYKATSTDITVKVGAKAIAKPTATTTDFVYTGNEQTYVPVDFDADTMEISGDKQTNANGTGYTVTVTPKANYVWSTDGDCKFTWVINRANITPSVTITGWTYGQNANAPGVTGNSGNGAVVYAYKVKNAADDTYTTGTPTNAGEYTVKATVATTTNFNGGSATLNFTIAKATWAMPTSMVGFTVNYAVETITPNADYEVSTASDFSSVLSTKTDITFGTTYYIRKAADNNHNASDAATYTPPRPAAPVLADFTVNQETVKNMGDATISSLTDLHEYCVSGGEYEFWGSGIDGRTSQLAGNATIKIRYAATENAFASEALTVTLTPSEKLITVKMGDESVQVAVGDKVEEKIPTKTGFTFGGWYMDEALQYRWDFSGDKMNGVTLINVLRDQFHNLTDDFVVTFYPKWIKNSAPSAVISGKVTRGGVAVSETDVWLRLGSKVVEYTTTDENGEYSFGRIENGTYNIVVFGDVTKTELVTVDTTDIFTKNVELPANGVSSVVERGYNDAAEGAKTDVDRIVVGGLDIIAGNTDAGANKVTIKLIVDPMNENDVESASGIKTLAGSGKKVEFLDLSLIKETWDAEDENIGSTNNTLLTIVLPFDFTNVDVSSVMVLRHHGISEKLQKNPAAGSEGFVVDKNAGTITIYAKKFSTYAVAYAEQSTGGGGSYTPGHTVTSDLDNVTKVTIDGKVVDSRYYTVSGGNVYLSGEFMKTLTAGKHTVKLYNGLKVATGVIVINANGGVVRSAATGDAGLVLYAALSVSSLFGMGWIGRKKRSK